MSNFPISIDDDISLPIVNDDITEVGSDAINALRDAVFNIETEIGLGSSGSSDSLASRLGISINADGTIKPSALTSIGLVTLPISDSQISTSAQIKESKLLLDFGTSVLNNKLVTQQSSLDNLLAFTQGTGSKIESHIDGSSYKHTLSHIDVALSSNNYLRNKNALLRDNTNSYALINDINNSLISHEKSNGSTGQVPPTNYGHVASGIYLNTASFSFVPQTSTDLQQFAQFIDNSNIFILGTRIQSLYSNGISRTARSSVLNNSAKGQSIVSDTTAITYLLNSAASAPVDNIDTGDDIIEFTPTASNISNSSFDAKFAAIKIGDIITVNYGGFTVSNIIKEKKITVSGSFKRYIVRIDRRNVLAGTYSARIDKPLFNNNKPGVLALAQANVPFYSMPSLIVGNPRGAQVIGLDFNPDHLDEFHYNLWLLFYPNGNPESSVVNLAAIDVTGNKGITPGKYTLDSIVEATNNNFRKTGYNYRFIAFAHKGEFGLMLADPYGNASFSIISGVLATTGLYDLGLSSIVYNNNVIGTAGYDNHDALGFGISKANVASPPYSATFVNSDTAKTPMKLFVPLARNNFYVNGIERERFNLEPGQLLDGYGDGYWDATIVGKTIVAGVRTEVTYQISKDLSSVRWQPGQTIVVQKGLTGGTVVDFGRFFIKDLQFHSCPGPTGYTNVVVYDAIHSTGSSPYLSAAVGAKVQLYFTSDSVSFSSENASDFSVITSPFKRLFEIFINQDGYSFSHERARYDADGTNKTVNGITLFGDYSLIGLDIYKVSSKLRGYAFSSVNKINLQISSFNQTTGVYSGYLCKYDGVTISNTGPVTTGKKGNIVRFYDETNVDYIDFIWRLDADPGFSTTKYMDIQLFPTLSLDDEVMLLGNCLIDDSNKLINQIRDARQFGNVSETQLSSSALDYISAPTQSLHENGVIKGLSTGAVSGDGYNLLYISGGTAVINGKIVNVNNEHVCIPIVRETLFPDFTTTISTIKWFVCLNESGKYEVIASTDFDHNGVNTTYYDNNYSGSNILPLTHERLFYVKNPNNSAGLKYNVKGTYFSDLVLNYKNLVPVALVTAPIVLSDTLYKIDSTITVKDIRRFVSEGHSGMNIPFSLGTHSNFRSVEAMVMWLTELNKFKSANTNVVNGVGDTVRVQSSMNVSSQTFDFGKKVKFIGDGGKFVINTATTMKNIALENLRIETAIGTAITFSGVENNINNCYFSHTTTASIYPLVIAASSSVRFTNNIFTSSVSITTFVNALETTLKQIFIGNVYKSGTTLTAATNVLPATLTTLNSADGA